MKVQNTQYFGDIATPTFAQGFFAMGSAFLQNQFAQTARQTDFVFAAKQNSDALVAATLQNTNQYFFGLVNSQSQMLNNIGTGFTEVAKISAQAQLIAAQRIKKPGFLSKLF